MCVCVCLCVGVYRKCTKPQSLLPDLVDLPSAARAPRAPWTSRP